VTISFEYILYCVCFNLFCNVCVGVCVHLCMSVSASVCLHLCVCVCVSVSVCLCLYVCVVFFCNMFTCIYCVLYCLHCVFWLLHLCIFILICLYYCKDYWHRVTTQLQSLLLLLLVVVVVNIIIHDNEKGTCMLIDVAISGDRNVIKKRCWQDSKI